MPTTMLAIDPIWSLVHHHATSQPITALITSEM
jgi:hypothetical protein